MELSKQHFRTTVPTAEQQKEMGKKYDSFFKNEKKRVMKYMDDECKRQRTAGLGEEESKTKAIEEAGAGKFWIKRRSGSEPCACWVVRWQCGERVCVFARASEHIRVRVRWCLGVWWCMVRDVHQRWIRW